MLLKFNTSIDAGQEGLQAELVESVLLDTVRKDVLLNSGMRLACPLRSWMGQTSI